MDNILLGCAWQAAAAKRSASYSPSRYDGTSVPQMSHIAHRLPFYELSPHNATAVVEAGRVRIEPPRTKVALVGCSVGRDEAPLDDPTWEVWSLNVSPTFDSQGRLRVDRWFDLHQRCAQTPEDLLWISGCPVPIYVPDDLLNASPNAVRYPIEAVEADLGVSYFTSTFAYWLALVLHERVATEVGLYGVELALGSIRERTVEASGVAYWLGRATERGLRVHVPRQTTLASHPFRYGLEYEAEKAAVEAYSDETAYIASRYRAERGLDYLRHAVTVDEI